MSYTSEHGPSMEDYNIQSSHDLRRAQRDVNRRHLLENLYTEVKKFVQQSSLLVGADKIREILRKLDE